MSEERDALLPSKAPMELKSCPFCGCAANFYGDMAWCDAQHILVELPIAAWNRRSDYRRGMEDAARIAADFGGTGCGASIGEAIRAEAEKHK